MKVLSLVDRETKQVRSMVVDSLKPATIAPILREKMTKEARLATNGAEPQPGWPWAWTTHHAQKIWPRVSSASASHIGYLTAPPITRQPPPQRLWERIKKITRHTQL